MNGKTMTDPLPSHDPEKHQSWLFSRTGLATLIVVAVLGFLTYTGHSAHLLGALPYLLLLCCPLMMFFMHGGHHGHDHKDDNSKEANESKKHDGGCH